MSSVVYQEVANSFTNGDQKILERDIAAIVYGPRPAPEAGVAPARAGEIYIQIPDGAADHKLHAWISVAKTISTFEWVPLNVGGPAPTNIALRDEANNFTNLDQTIDGDKILSFIKGSGTTPQGTPAKYDGQLYISFKTLESGPDVAVWVASGNTWVPIVKEAVDVTKFAKLDASNVFENLVQMLGPASDGRLINGTRIKRTGNAPAFDAAWLAKVEGETTIYFKPDSVPQEVSIWTAISATGTNPANHWKMTWSSAGSSVDTSNLAKLNAENVFTIRQKIGNDANNAHFTSGRKSALDPLAVTSPDYVPFASGDIFVREYLDAGATEHKIYVSTGEGDADSWLCIYDSKLSTVALDGRVTALEAYDDTLDVHIAGINGEIDSLGAALNTTNVNLTALETDVGLEKTKLTGIDTRMGNAESKITALETHHTNNQATFSNHGDRIATAELDIDNILIDVGEKGTTITSLVSDMAIVKPLKPEVDSLKTTTVGLVGTTNNHTTRLDTADDKFAALEASDTTINGKIDTHGVSIAAAQADADEAYNKAVTADSNATFAKNKVGVIEPKVTTLETKVATLEAKTVSFKDLTDTPSTLTASKLLCTNADGTAVVESAVTPSDVSNMKTGLGNGHFLVSHNSRGMDTHFTSGDVSAESCKASTMLIVSPSTASKVMSLSDIVAHDVTTLDTVSVREGRTTWVSNQSTRNFTINSKRGGMTGKQKLYVKGVEQDSIVLDANSTMILHPTIFSDGSKRWIVIAKIANGL